MSNNQSGKENGIFCSVFIVILMVVMKQILPILFILACLFFVSCNSNDLPPAVVTDPIVNPYAGTFTGLFKEEYNGVDSTGVFKNSDSSTYTVEVLDAGTDMITISKGDFIFDHMPVDSSGYFSTDSPYVSTDSLDYSISGQYRNDSLYIYYKALNGSYNYPVWFVIIQFTFKGKKVL